jgi:LPS O-antigen subunit length determinant protein (WzzB/FepE family)
VLPRGGLRKFRLPRFREVSRVTAGEDASNQRGNGLDFIELLQTLWCYKATIVVITTLAAVAALTIALIATPIFRAEVVITDVREAAEGGLASLAGQLSGLGSLAGVNLSGANSVGQEARAVLQSRHLIEEFINRNDLLTRILPNSKEPPLMWLAVKRFQNTVLGIHEDTRKGTITIAIEWTDPVVAARWANGFVALANDLLRSRAIEESKRNVAYLNDQITHTDSVEIRGVMYDLIKTETKTLMLANGRVDYAFRVVDPAVPPAQRSKPQRAAIVLSGVILGFFFSCIVMLCYARIRSRRELVQAAAHTPSMAR